MAVKPGDILRDKYRIDALIGRGGMGQVFSATQLDAPDRPQFAIKVVSRLLVDDILMVRLHREAQAAQRIQSDLIPRVFEVSDTEEGETFLVMERLIGEPLSQTIREHGALPWPEVAKIGEDILRALIDAHTAGVVHRDLKPSNVFLAENAAGRSRAMVLDFGVCKMDGLDAERLTGTGESIGTVAYMAPEQIRGAARVDERADLYAFGVLVFEMICGRLPHDGPSQMAILASKLENAAARLRDCSRVPVPEGTDELVARALAREPKERFHSAQELMKAWRTLTKSDRMKPASTPPPALGDDEPTLAGPKASDGDHPTEVSGPLSLSLPGPPPTGFEPLASDQTNGDSRIPFDLAAVHAVHQSSFPGGFPVDPHSTQHGLTTHHTSILTGEGRKTRLAVVLAAAALVVGVVIVGVALGRGSSEDSPEPSAATEPPAAAGSATTGTGSIASAEPAPDPAPTDPSFELPPDPPENGSAPSGTARSSKPRVRVARPPPPPAPKASSPRITSQPRY